MVGPAFRAPPRPEAFRAERKRYWLEGSIFVLVLIIAVMSGLISVDPKMQARTTAWINKALHAVGVPMSPVADKIGTEPETPSLTPVTPGNPSPSQFTPPPWALSTPASQSPAPTSGQARTSPYNAAPAGNASNPNSSATGAAAPTASVAPPAPASTSTPPTPAPAPPESPAAEAPAVAPTPAPADDDPFERARILRRQAIDAENSGDYAHAVALFQSIKDLPREVWPGDLELRLRAAKANLDAQNQQH
jgi:hypothetical protein